MTIDWIRTKLVCPATLRVVAACVSLLAAATSSPA